MVAATSPLERRIARVARRSARVILALRAEGNLDAARKLEAAACEAVEQMRKGAL
jgi:hypothetical protein